MDRDETTRFRDDGDLDVGESYGNEPAEEYFGERIPYSDPADPTADLNDPMFDESAGETDDATSMDEGLASDSESFQERLDHTDQNHNLNDDQQGLGDKIKEKYNDLNRDL